MLKRWKLIKSVSLVKSKWLSLYNNTYLLPNGEIKADYYHLSKPSYTLIVALNSKKEIILEKNYRRGVCDTLIELPAGYIRNSETPIKSAKRELKEETGYDCKVRFTKKIYPYPSFCNMVAYVVLVDLVGEPTKKKLEEDEENEVFFADLPKINTMIKQGKIRDMGLICALKLVEPLL